MFIDVVPTSFLKLKNNLPFWCFSFVTLFNLQGTRRRSRQILMLPQLIRFVKKNFSFIRCDVVVIIKPPRQATSIDYHTFRTLSRTFFKNFRSFFLTVRPEVFCPGRHAKRLHIIANHIGFVNPIFPLFSPQFSPHSFPVSILRSPPEDPGIRMSPAH